MEDEHLKPYQLLRIYPFFQNQEDISDQRKGSHGLVERIQYNEIPLRVEYHLTETGKNIIPALDLIYVWSIHRMRELDIEIDPDAFVVHPEDKYEGSLKKFLDHYDDICAVMEYANDHDLDGKEVLDIIKAHESSN